MKKKPVSLIKELRAFGSFLPLSDREIISRVSKGEDLQFIDIGIVRKNYKLLKFSFPYAKIYCAVKALSLQKKVSSIVPRGGMISLLDHLGSHFEIATVEEYRKLKSLGISPKRIFFTHPDKDDLEVEESYKGGVRFFVSDSLSDLNILSRKAPGVSVLVRIKTTKAGPGSWFNNRFGISPDRAKKLLKEAQKLSLNPIGISFHCGTQAENPKLWEKPIKDSANIFKDMKETGLTLDYLDIGGGFPAPIKKGIPSYSEYGKVIKTYLKKYFKKDLFPKKIIIEPGRALSGMSGVTIGRVINTKYIDRKYIVTVSPGKYSAGMDGIGYNVNFYFKSGHSLSCPEQDFILGSVYGKACSTIDIIEASVRVPKKLQSGDLVVFSGTGAYSSHTSSSNWCGRKSPTQIIFDSQ